MTNPKEPTLTCSEVVERLRDECMHGNAWFNSGLAEKILGEWREPIAKHSGCPRCADSALGEISAPAAKETRKAELRRGWISFDDEMPKTYLSILIAFNENWTPVAGFYAGGSLFYEYNADAPNTPIRAIPDWWKPLGKVPHEP